MSFFAELKRRNVFRVGIAYLIGAWLLLQIADVVLNNIAAPGWVFKSIMLLVGLGLPLSLFFAWAFELTPEGIKKEKDVDRSQSVVKTTGRKLDYGIIAVLVVILVYFVYDKFGNDPVIAPADLHNEQAQVSSGQTAGTRATTENSEPSIAVLPFVNMSNDPDQTYFSDGISEEILNVLVRVEGLKVASRTSSFTFKGENLNIPEIATELKVNHILEGSVRKAGNRVRITAQLIDTSNDRHLWSETFDRELVDIFAIQDEIAAAIVTALKDKLGITDSQIPVSVTAATDNLDAYDLYLKGRSLFLTRADIAQAISLLEQAVTLDPEFARAWETLAAAYFVAPGWIATPVGHDYYDKALQASDQALALDPALSLPWAVKGFLPILMLNPPERAKRFEIALQYLDKAIAADANNATAHLWRAIAWSTLGFHDKADADLVQCLDIDPAYSNCKGHRTLTLYYLGDFGAARTLLEESTAASRMLLGYGRAIPILALHGSRIEALLMAQIIYPDPVFPWAELVDAIRYPQRDHSLGKQRLLAYLRDNDAKDSPFGAVIPLLAFGAFEQIKRTGKAPENWIWDPAFPDFRHSQRFQKFVREIGLQEYWREFGFPPQCRAVGEEGFECD